MTQSNSAYARLSHDKYYTPSWCTETLLDVETFDGGVWDPAAGAGHILDACVTMGIKGPLHGTDIAPDSPSIKEADFLKVPFANSWPNIVTNPPYGAGGRLAVKFIEQALRLTQSHGGKVAMLLRVDFDSANGRRHIFADHPAFAAKYTLTRRIRWANLVQSDAGPTENHAWLVWDWRKRGGDPVLKYLPIEVNP